MDSNIVTIGRFNFCINKRKMMKGSTGIMKDINGRRMGNLAHPCVSQEKDSDAAVYLIAGVRSRPQGIGINKS